jgi:hypothetical protein
LARIAVAGISASAAVIATGCGESSKQLDASIIDTGTNPTMTTCPTPTPCTRTSTDVVLNDSARMIEEGRRTFRFDTFGDEAFWGGQLKLHQAIAGQANGGVGAGLSPKQAFMVGLKVDVDAIPPALAAQIKAGQVNLDDPATTLSLLQLNAVVGLTGFFAAGTPGVAQMPPKMTSIGIQCALCHSTVDDSFMAGIGKRLDGWPNRDLNVGAIIALAPDLSHYTNLLQVPLDTVKRIFMSWGPGKFDAELVLDGKAFRPDGGSAATLLPAAFGLAGVNLHTYTGWGSVTHWNAFVANIDMMGQGTLFDPRLDNAAQFPIAARARFGHIQHDQDLVSPKLPALHYYQLSLLAPKPKDGTFDKNAAARGDVLFGGKAKCTSCHVEPTHTEPGWNMHTGAEIGIDDFQANRAPDRRYRTTPLNGLFTRQKGGFYHDGRFRTLRDVIDHYDALMSLRLTDQEKIDIEQYLLSI